MIINQIWFHREKLVLYDAINKNIEKKLLFLKYSHKYNKKSILIHLYLKSNIW